MAYRSFTDQRGRTWEVRDRSKSEWEFLPMGSNPERPKTVRAPGYEKDPFELSIEELQRLLDEPDVSGARTRPTKSPFKD